MALSQLHRPRHRHPRVRDGRSQPSGTAGPSHIPIHPTKRICRASLADWVFTCSSFTCPEDADLAYGFPIVYTATSSAHCGACYTLKTQDRRFAIHTTIPPSSPIFTRDWPIAPDNTTWQWCLSSLSCYRPQGGYSAPFRHSQDECDLASAEHTS